ncbi:carbonic anhydrase 7-like [Haliotis rubra]|uniref:carbonic anhydrase 7-like n=1 Tax=Haliotis rubra TaxID=36100 RepID=UPI001EE61F84|nr:carbonic anhydrase 7-like [Haliotis rubra]
MGCLNVFKIIVVVIPLALEKTVAGAETWGYFGNIGPANWTDINPTCGGQRQSPINIQAKQAQAKKYDPFVMHNFDTTNATLVLKNRGHTAQIDLSGPHLKVSGGGLNGDYITIQLHLHWGKTSSNGSEHTLDGTAYPMELHIATYKASYGTPLEALDQADGIAALGFFVEIGNTTQKGLETMADALPQVLQNGTNTTMMPFKLEEFLPNDLKNFYRYLGSFTTPTCNESVIWTVFTDTIKITEEKLAEFRKLQSGEMNDNGDYNMYDNFRPIQSLGTRVVYSSFGIYEPSGAHKSNPLTFSLFVLLATMNLLITT